MLLRWSQQDLSDASGVSLATIKRLESCPGVLVAHMPTINSLILALTTAGLELLNKEHGGGIGVRFQS
jgi:hypothetical protein